MDAKAISDYKIPGLVLMENAGKDAFEILYDYFEEDLELFRILIICGKGNNGGDGFVLARHLYNNGFKTGVLILDNPGSYSGDAKVNLNILLKLGCPVKCIKNFSPKKLLEVFKGYTMIVDAVFGTGFKGVPRDFYKHVIDIINDYGSITISLDIPSGLNPDTGIAEGSVVNADITITMGLPKLGMMIYPGHEYCGEIFTADISMPPELLYDRGIPYELIDEYCLPHLERRPDTHKGCFGKILIIGTSPGLTGAGYLAGQAALKSGAGMITLAVPKSINPILESKLTEVMTLPVSDSDGHFSLESLDEVLIFSEKSDVIVLGPGLGRHPDTITFAKEFIKSCTKPLIIDADGLYSIQGALDLVRNYSAPVILTPHLAEFARLTGDDIDSIKSNKVKKAISFAVKNNILLVLKGAETLIATEKGDLFINLTGNPGMATGGMGDVLSGFIASLIGQDVSVNTAAVTAAYLLGRAGDELLPEVGYAGINPSEVIEILPFLIKEYLEEDESE